MTSYRSRRSQWVFGVCIALLSVTGAEAQEDRTTSQFRDRFVPVRNSAARQNLDAAIERAGSYDFDTASEALNTHLEDYNSAFTASFQDNIFPTGICQIWGIMSDRRVARLFEFLSEMSAQEAASRASALFDEKLKIHVAGWTDGFAERAAGRQKSIPIERNTHALRSALFLVACYCDSATVLKKIEDWDAAMTPAGLQTLLHPRLIPLRSYLLTQGLPDNLYIANIMLVALHRSGRLTPERLEAAQELGLPKVEMYPLMAWNAHTGPFDWIRRKGGVRIDTERVLTESPATSLFWETRSYEKLDVQEGIIAYLRTELGGQVSLKAELQPTPAEK